MWPSREGPPLGGPHRRTRRRPLRHVAVDHTEDVVARLRTHGAELVGELVQYGDGYRLCYVRGPEGVIVAAAEQLGRAA